MKSAKESQIIHINRLDSKTAGGQIVGGALRPPKWLKSGKGGRWQFKGDMRLQIPSEAAT
jgi:hypothetical protein